jgi:hypothetical protein
MRINKVLNYRGIKLFSIITALVVPLLVNIKAIYYNCYNAIDFSIYQQAIYNIGSLGKWNPYLSIRNINIFNDHFDPILYALVGFTKIFGQGFQQLLIFEWMFFFLIACSIYYVLEKEEKDQSHSYLICLVFTKLLLLSFLFPIHPTTWSSLPLFWITYFILNNKDKSAMAVIILLCIFKESFSFAFLPLGIYIGAKRDKKAGAGIVIVTLLFISFELYFKEKLIGPGVNYGGRVLNPLLNEPFLFISKILLNLNIGDFLKSFYPFIGAISLWFYQYTGDRKKIIISKILPISLYFLPLLSLQIYANKINFQYGSQFGAILIAFIVSVGTFKGLSKVQSRIIIVLFILSSMGIYTSSFKALFINGFSEKKCVISESKLEDSRKIKEVILKASPLSKILSTGGVIPFIMTPNRNINQLSGFSKKYKSYDYILLELNRSGDIYPSSQEQVSNVLKKCRPMAKEIIIENKYYFFAKGEFKNCAN